MILPVTGGVLAYEVRGAGPAIIFMHGIGSIGEVWAPQVAEFATDHTCISLDMRGHGGSMADPGTISIKSWAEDALAVLEAERIPGAHICGLSLGGVVALEVWRQRPAAVLSLVLADTWAHHPAAVAGQAARLRAIDSTPLPELAAVRMPAVLAPGAAPELVRRSIEVMAAKDRACYRRSSEVLWVSDQREVAATVTVPTLVLVGELDAVTPPRLAEELAGLIQKARLAVIPGAGHLSSADHPADFNREVRIFLMAVSGR